MTDFEVKTSKISPSERRILQCLSLFWEQITAQEFQKLLRILDLKTPEGKVFSMQYVSLLRNSLIHKGLLYNTSEYWGNGFQIADELKDFFTREAMREDWFSEVVEKIQTNFSLGEFSSWYQNGERYKSRLLRDYRLSIYRQDKLKMITLSEIIKERNLEIEANNIRFRIFSEPFQKEFLAKFEPRFQTEILLDFFGNAIENGIKTDEFWDFVRESKIDSEPFQIFEVLEKIFKGELSEAKRIIGTPHNLHALISSMLIAVLEKDYEKAAIFGEEAVKFWRKWFSKKKGFPVDWRMFFYGLALFKTNEAKFLLFAEEFSGYSSKNNPASTVHYAISSFANFLKNKDDLAQIAASQVSSDTFLEKFIRIVLTALVPTVNLPNYVKEFSQQAQNLGYKLLQLEAANLLSVRGKSNLEARKTSETLQAELEIEPVGNIVPKLEDWERALNTLMVVAEKVQGKSGAKTAAIDETRVAWLLNFDHKEVQPVEQKFGKKGWTDGRNIALKRLYERDVKNLSEQDSFVVKIAMKKFQDYYSYGSFAYDFDWEKSLSALVGHPFLFLFKNPSVNVQLISGEPSLLIRQTKDDLELSFDTKFSDEGVIVEKETETRYKVIEISKHHVDIAGSLKENRLKIPAKGREKLLKAIQPLSTRISIQSDLEEHFENLPSVEAENRIHALITPNGEGFHLEFFTKPFGSVPPYFKPGKGGESVIADVDGVRTQNETRFERRTKPARLKSSKCVLFWRDLKARITNGN